MRTFGRRLWSAVREWFVRDAQHVTVEFLPDGSEPVAPNQGYLRLWLAEGFLAKERNWTNDQFPIVHGGASMQFLGGNAAFTTFNRPPEAWKVPGAQLDFPITPLLPFTGGTVEIEAALYQATTGGPIGTAVELLGGIAKLIGPPLATAANIADKVSDGLAAVLTATGDKPVLGLHYAMVSAGGIGNPVRSGHVVVIDPGDQPLPGAPVIVDGRLHLRTGEITTQATGVDYLVVRVECRAERDDWRFPEIDELMRDAGAAFVRGQKEAFDDISKQVLALAMGSADFVPRDRKRVALLLRDELDGFGELGIVAGQEFSLAEAAPNRLCAADDDRLNGLTLTSLLRG